MPQTVVSSSMVPFATQLSETVFSLLHETARREGRQVQDIVEDALLEYISARQHCKTRRHVAEALEASMAEFDSLYDKLSR